MFGKYFNFFCLELSYEIEITKKPIYNFSSSLEAIVSDLT